MAERKTTKKKVAKTKRKKTTRKKTTTKKKVVKKRTTSKYLYAKGRRKSAIATVRLLKGKGDDIINEKKLKEIYPSLRDQRDIYSPFEVTDNVGKFYMTVKVKGGGKRGQLEAIQLAISRALLVGDPEYRKELKKHSLLTVDSRVKERKKPGLKKARKKEQYSKR